VKTISFRHLALPLALAFFSFAPKFSYAAGIEILEDSATAYKQTLELCTAAKSFKQSLTQSLKLFRYYWSGMKTFGTSPLMPSRHTMHLYNNPGYWQALDKCYGAQDNVMHYTFSVSIGLLDDLGSITDIVITFGALKVMTGMMGLGKLAIWFPKTFAVAGKLLAGTTAVAAVWSLVDAIKSRRKNAKLAQQFDAAQAQGGDPSKLFEKMVDEDLKAVVQLLQDRVNEITTTLANNRDLTPERRTKLENDLEKLQQILEERRNPQPEKQKAA